MRQELYRGNIYRVVWSQEEKAAAMADGWSEIMEPGVEYRHFQHAEPEAAASEDQKEAQTDASFAVDIPSANEYADANPSEPTRTDANSDGPARGKKKGRR